MEKNQYLEEEMDKFKDKMKTIARDHNLSVKAAQSIRLAAGELLLNSVNAIWGDVNDIHGMARRQIKDGLIWKYFSGETPRRGDVVQRVDNCEEPHATDGFIFGDLCFVLRVLDDLIEICDDNNYCGEWESKANRWQLVSRGNL